MSKFKIGDKVRDISYSSPTEEVCTVVEVRESHVRVHYRGEEAHSMFFPEADYELLAVATPLGTQLTKAEYLAFIEKTFAEMTTLIKAKNSDYTAGSDDPFANFRQSVDYGVDPLSGVMVRVGDKLQRIKSFTKAGKLEVANEGVEDAFKDLIGYSLIALGMLSERKPD